MGHSIYNRYNMKLNKESPTYDHLMASIQSYLKECLHIEESSDKPGESYGASLKEDKGEIIVSFFNYKSSAPVSLSNEVLNLIQKNIDTDPSKFYYYLEEEGYRNWSVSSVYGKAAIVLNQYTLKTSISESDEIIMQCFKDSLYQSFETSITITDVDSIIRGIKTLEQKAHILSYSNKNVNRRLIPLLRRTDGSVILAGYHLHRPELVLYVMHKSANSKGLSVVYANMGEVTLIDYLNNKKHTIAANLMNPKLVSVQVDSRSSYNIYTRQDNFTHHHEGSIPLFDDNGPLIKITNKLESLQPV